MLNSSQGNDNRIEIEIRFKGLDGAYVDAIVSSLKSHFQVDGVVEAEQWVKLTVHRLQPPVSQSSPEDKSRGPVSSVE